MSDAVFKCLAEIQPEPVRWLWEGRIPLGKVTLLEGDPGIGKSSLALELAARVSRGSNMPLVKGPAGEPADVVIFSGDDGLADTVRPRLDVAGANLARIWAVDREFDKDDAAKLHPALIILDPLSSYIRQSAAQDPVSVMRHLGLLARDTGAAVMALRSTPDHEDEEHNPEIYATPRSVLSLTAVGHGGRRLSLFKSNLRHVPDIHPLVYYFDDDGGDVRIVNWSDGR